MPHVDAHVAEYLELGQEGRRAPYYEVRDERGVIEFCGTHEAATLTLVRPGALVILGVGTREHTVERFETLTRTRAPLNEIEPAEVVWGGQRRGFRPLGGAHLVGAVEREGEAVLLLLVEERAVVVLVQGRQKRVMALTAWNAMGRPDIDSFTAMVVAGRRSREADAVARTCGALFGLGARAAEVGATHRMRGSTTIAAFAVLLAELVRHGCGDVCGGVSKILRSIQQYRPTTDLTVEQLSDALTLLYATGTVLVDRPTARTWAVRLGEVQRSLARQFQADGVAPAPTSQPSSFRRRRRAAELQAAEQGPVPAAPEPVRAAEAPADWRSVLTDTAAKLPG